MTRPPVARHPPAGDSRRTPSTVLSVLARLTDRDLSIVDWLDRHGVFTTDQLTAAFFGAASTASHRLLTLHRLGLIDRFHRPRPAGGFSPWHWVIGPLGVQLAAAARGEKPPSAKTLRERHARLARNPALEHHLAANQFFIDLYRHARHHPRAWLLRWWSARQTADAFHQRIHPDGHALWRESTPDGTVTVGLFLEYDTGTERPIGRLVDKLHQYEELAGDGGPAYPVLFVLPSADREHRLHAVLAAGPARTVPVASTARSGEDAVSPVGPVWLLAGQGYRRRLIELPSQHGRPGSLYRGNGHRLEPEP
ncbi:replication-relaxation family protein [Phytohabitans aurantiacus]|jgi:hypothetical protein|uniref:Protein involved in plasmid replication-relaxation n=1 Tax=Phytohabitans aurantiacus TaxID=3016789 RepID=A0ABQ5R9D1_9ACTN|nr:replication-relaxation family protein [Phytohabitans aurantiacus]GLI02995.1 hypothetical protein Pa4123_82730 [Phytohabitans aurantiacus]